MKRRSIIPIIVLPVSLAVLIVSLLFITMNTLKNSAEKEQVVRSSLMGKVFSGNRREYSTRSGGAINLVEFMDIKIVCEFGMDGTVHITRTESYCDGIATIADGNIAYNNERTKTSEHKLKEISISSAGNCMITIGRNNCLAELDDDCNPIAIEIDGTKCALVE